MPVHIYSIFLRLYPASHRERFGAEMTEVFAYMVRERNCRNLGCLWLVIRELSSLLTGALREWFAKTDIRLPEGLNNCAEAGLSLQAWEITAAQNRIQMNVSRMVDAIAHHQFEKARHYAREEQREREQLTMLEQRYSAKST